MGVVNEMKQLGGIERQTAPSDWTGILMHGEIRMEQVADNRVKFSRERWGCNGDQAREHHGGRSGKGAAVLHDDRGICEG